MSQGKIRLQFSGLQHTPKHNLSAAHPYVDYHLPECKALDDIRKHLHPPRTNKMNTLYGNRQQLRILGTGMKGRPPGAAASLTSFIHIHLLLKVPS